jgi:hypothetical protein
MSCMPPNTKNERCYCEPFVVAYNEYESRRFAFHSIPDQTVRTRPMPDALYHEADGDSFLAIERKSVIWPDDFARHHSLTHRIIENFYRDLPERIANGPYVLSMPLTHFARRDDEIEELAREICGFVANNLALLDQHEYLAFSTSGPQAGEYSIRRKAWSDHTEDSECRWDQLLIVMSGPHGNIPRFDWRGSETDHLRSKLERFQSDLSRKFEAFPEARKILLLQRFGDIRGPLVRSFERLIQQMKKSAALDEVWDVWLETPDCEDPYWNFTRLWAKNPALPPRQHHAEVCCRRKCFCEYAASGDDVFQFVKSRIFDY